MKVADIQIVNYNQYAVREINGSGEVRPRTVLRQLYKRNFVRGGIRCQSCARILFLFLLVAQEPQENLSE
jgi:hypothetical protein